MFHRFVSLEQQHPQGAQEVQSQVLFTAGRCWDVPWELRVCFMTLSLPWYWSVKIVLSVVLGDLLGSCARPIPAWLFRNPTRRKGGKREELGLAVDWSEMIPKYSYLQVETVQKCPFYRFQVTTVLPALTPSTILYYIVQYTSWKIKFSWMLFLSIAVSKYYMMHFT